VSDKARLSCILTCQLGLREISSLHSRWHVNAGHGCAVSAHAVNEFDCMVAEAGVQVLDLRSCKYPGANLSGKVLSGALMSDADFSKANLKVCPALLACHHREQCSSTAAAAKRVNGMQVTCCLSPSGLARRREPWAASLRVRRCGQLDIGFPEPTVLGSGNWVSGRPQRLTSRPERPWCTDRTPTPCSALMNSSCTNQSYFRQLRGGHHG
jgi:Pentapeptide repeats (8 copies)